MFDLNSYLKDLAEICAMDTGKHNADGIAQIVEWFRVRYEDIKLKTQIVSKDDKGICPMILISNSAGDDILQSDKGIDALFVAHLDTVFDSDNIRSRHFTVDANGIGYGPGCIDCKGGALLILYLIREMLAANECNFNFVIAMNSDEETGSLYSKQFFDVLAKRSKYAFIFEPGRGDDQYVGVRKGGAKYRIVCHGIAAHSGADFFKGANAIVELAKWVPRLTELISEEDETTVNIATFNGGLNNGLVPDRAELLARLLYMDTSAFDKMDTLFQEMKSHPYDDRCSIEVEEVGIRRSPLLINENGKILHQALKRAAEKTGNTSDWVSTGGMSDGNWIACHGVGTLDGCGPCGAKMHTNDEYIKTWTVKNRFDTLRELLTDLYN